MAAVIQRMVSNKNEEGSSFLTDEEKESLLNQIKDIGESQESLEVKERSLNEPTKDDN